MSIGRWGLGLLLAVACLAQCPNASAAGSHPPPGFFGVVPQAPPTTTDLDRMQGVVGTLRMPILWGSCEPAPGQYDFAALDQLVGDAADRGIRILPFVYATPAWISADPARPPLSSPSSRAAWASFLRRLVDRYGRNGTFWRARPHRLPIRVWQIWNEPNFLLFWHPRPAPAAYARLVGIASRAIRSRDHGARVALAGLAPVNAGLVPWDFLRQMYRAPGVRRSFDLVAVHPYASTVLRVSQQIRQMRKVMSEAGDGAKQLLVSELGVASGGLIQSTFVKGLDGQAAFLRRAFGMLLAKRSRWRVAGVDWFAWQDVPAADAHCSFCQGAGLFDVDGRPKPSWRVFRDLAGR